ncbi:MAG TPA: hypothetical protein V6D23_13875 [Candidatus Obscuribacterales bacterium]
MRPENLDTLWERALTLWSPYLRLPPPRWCETPAELQAAGLSEQLAQFRLDRREVVLNGPQLKRRGLLLQLPAILSHEIGHYACCPGTAELHVRLCARAFAALPEVREQVAMVVNLFQDLLINTRLQLEKGCDLRPLLLALRPPDPDPFWEWALRICEIRWRLPGQSLSRQASDDPAEADAILAARLIQPRGRHLLENMHAFAGLCESYLPQESTPAPWLDLPAQAKHGLPAGLIAQPTQPGQPEASEPGNGKAPGRGTSLGAPRQYLEPPAYAALLAVTGFKNARHDWLVQYYRERAWPHLLPELRPSGGGWEPQHPEGTRPWELDRPVTDIDWTASLVQSPVVVPGMTTLRRQQAWEREATVIRPEHLDLYLDASGSVPDPAASCSPLVLAATILVLSALRLGIAVRVTCYSGQDQVLGTDYLRQGETLLRALISYPGGATSFPLPLLARRYRQREATTQLLIISDEGYRAALQPAPDGEAGETILKHAAAQAAGATLLLQLLTPGTPPDLAPLIASGWQLHLLDPAHPESLKQILQAQVQMK